LATHVDRTGEDEVLSIAKVAVETGAITTLVVWSSPVVRDGLGAVIMPLERGPAVLAVKDSKLVAQDDDLDVFGAARLSREAGQRCEEAVQDARHSPSASAVFPLISAHGRVSGTHVCPEGK
jgi:hypothetical protein